MRIGEVTTDHNSHALNHAVKACNVHIAENKEKVKFMLYTSKTHGKESYPQKIGISSESNLELASGLKRTTFFCLIRLVKNYRNMRGGYDDYNEPFFIFRGKIPVLPQHARKVLKLCLRRVGLDEKLYDFHSLRAGCCVDLIKHYHYSIKEVKHIGRWKSNAIYRYIKM